jgi:TRAP-type mannitol/chloroaromatic compound transport system substrate-binding protein
MEDDRTMSEATRRVTRRSLLASAAGVGVAAAVAGCTAPPSASPPTQVPKSQAAATPQAQATGSAPATAPAQAASTPAASTQASGSAPVVQQAPSGGAGSAATVTWKLQSTWAASDFLQNNATDLATSVAEMSEGRLRLDVLAAGSIVPAPQVIDAVSQGLLDAGHGSPAYWYGKHPATALFLGVPAGPFGMNHEEFMGWMYEGGGTDLYNELLQNELKLDVVSFPTVLVPPEPLGWFARPVGSVDDLKGVKFRSVGMAGETFKEVGMTVVNIPPAEIVPALERRVIDAAELLSPVADQAAGFQDAAKYYHMPSTHQSVNALELLINRRKWDELSSGLKSIVRHALSANMLQFQFKLMKANTQALEDLVSRAGVQVVETPREVQVEIMRAWDRVAARYAEQNPFFGRVLDSQRQWAQRAVNYRRVAYPPAELTADHYWAGKNPYKGER